MSKSTFSNWYRNHVFSLATASRKVSLSKVSASVALGLFAVAVHAQEDISTQLNGRIIQANDGRALEGAIIKVADTELETFADSTGRFTLRGLKPGQYQLKISYVGLLPKAVDVTVGGRNASPLTVTLNSADDLDTLVVSGARSSSSRAINQQKTAAGIVNFIPEEQFGSMVDGNVGQALQRLPGLSVNQSQDGSQGSINIRGIAGDYNSVQLDGNRLSSSGFSNSFNPRDLSADSITTIEVIKAPTPDRDGDAVGGIINLVTRNAFQRAGQEMSLDLGGQLNDASDKWGHRVNFDFSDIYSVNGGINNLGVSFSVSTYDTDRYSVNADQDWVRVDPETNPELDIARYNEPVWFMESTHFEHDTRTTETFTLNGSIDFMIGNDNSFYLRPLYSKNTRSGVKYETDLDIDSEFENELGGNKTYAALTPTMGRGTADSDASRGWIGTLEDVDNEMYGLTFGAEHDFQSSTLKYDINYSKNERTINHDTELNTLMEPENPFIFQYDIIDPDGYVAITDLSGNDPTDLSQLTEGELEVINGTREEEVFSSKIDWERYFLTESMELSFKTGAKYRVSQRQQDLTVDLYEMDDAFPYADVLTPVDQTLLLKPKYFNVNPRAGLDLLNSNPSLFELNNEDTLIDSNLEDFDAEETISAAYVMGTLQSGIHTVIAGVRYENFAWEATNKAVSFLDSDGTVTDIYNDDSHSFWLPGLHLRHELSNNLILRESYNRSYGRPRLSELAMGREVDDEGNIEDGNPRLKPAVSDNYDIQLEYFTDQGGLYSIGYFYKDIADFSYTLTYNFDVLDENGIPVSAENGDFEYERPENGTDATSKGVEIIAQQDLYFLPGMLKGLSVALSATFTSSDADYPNRTDRKLPLEGFSEKLYTASLAYNWNKFSARIDYRYRDEYIEGLGDDIESDEFFAAEYRLDAEVYYQLTDNLMLSATATNLTDEGQISYQGYARFVEDASYAGRKFMFGLQYDF